MLLSRPEARGYSIPGGRQNNDGDLASEIARQPGGATTTCSGDTGYPIYLLLGQCWLVRWPRSNLKVVKSLMSHNRNQSPRPC